MDRLLERCAKHRKSTKGKKQKKTRASRQNIGKPKQHTSLTTQARQTSIQTTNQQQKAAKNANMELVIIKKQLETAQVSPIEQTTTKKRPLTEKEKPPHTSSQEQSSKTKEKKNSEDGNGLIPTACLPVVEPHPNSKKLSRKAKADVLAMLAMNYTSRSIVVWLMQNHHVRVRRQNIDSYRNKQRSKICQTRDILAKDIQKAVPTALKLNRVAIRDEMIQDLRRRPWKQRTQETINRILDSIKAEMEPLEVNVRVNLKAKTAQEYKDVTSQGVITEAMDRLKAAGMEVAQVVPKSK